MAARILPKLVYPSEIRLVYVGIQSTVNHRPKTTGEAILCDLDLLGLAGSTEEVEMGTAQIRQEYARLSDLEWWQGRAKFILDLLARDRIFNTMEIYRRFEVPVRRNLKALYQECQRQLDILAKDN